MHYTAIVPKQNDVHCSDSSGQSDSNTTRCAYSYRMEFKYKNYQYSHMYFIRLIVQLTVYFFNSGTNIRTSEYSEFIKDIQRDVYLDKWITTNTDSSKENGKKSY